MLCLCRQASVGSSYRPLICTICDRLCASQSQHWFDCEAHTWFQPYASTGHAKMWYSWGCMKNPFNSVAAVSSNHAKLICLRVLLYCCPNISNSAAWLYGGNSNSQAFLGYTNKPGSFVANLANCKCAAGVTEPSVNNRCDVNVDYVAIFKNVCN